MFYDNNRESVQIFFTFPLFLFGRPAPLRFLLFVFCLLVCHGFRFIEKYGLAINLGKRNLPFCQVPFR